MSKKSPSYGKQLILAATLFAFGTTAYWLVYSKQPKEEEKKAEERRVFNLKDRKVSAMEFGGTGLSVRVQCLSLKEGLCKTDSESKWGMTLPLQTKGDDTTLNSLLKNLSNLTISEVIDLSTDTAEKRESLLNDFGLSAQKRAVAGMKKIRMDTDDGRSSIAYFGEKHPISEGFFALIESGPAGKMIADESKVYIIPEWQLSALNQKTSYFRDKKLISIVDKEIDGFTIDRSRKMMGKLEAVKDSITGKWTLRQGGKSFDGDQDAVEGLLSGAVFLTAKDYIAEKKDSPEAKKILSGMKPIFDLTLKTKSDQAHLKLFGKPSNPKEPKGQQTIYGTLENQDPVFEIDSPAFDKLDKTFGEYRVSKLIGVVDRYAINHMHIEVKGKKPFSQDVNKEAGVWKIEGKESARGRVEGLLDRLTSKVVLNFSAPSPSGETLKITFGKTQSEPLHEFLFWKTGSRLFARDLKSKEHESVELSSDFALQLPWDERLLKDVNFGSQAPGKNAHE